MHKIQQPSNINRQKLLESFQSLEAKFESSLDKAKKHEKDFEDLRQNFMRQFSAHLSVASNRLPDSNPLKQQVLGFIEVMKNTQNEWDIKVAGREKGVEFREKFEDSLLVFINGKVKSGKSSLGNYIAWGHTDPDAALKAQALEKKWPEYFSGENNHVDGGDAKGEAEDRREFRVGATEATSSIQGFTLPGLTWVDSPGLHSVKIENEQLARDYVEHADLILYTMKSDAPGRASDLAEIQQLLGKNKKVIILLTGSDDTKEEYNSEIDDIVTTVVVKDAHRRKQQEDYVREALQELANQSGDNRINNVEIVSISARYAQLNADDPVAFAESGMGMLCETLHEISQSEGVQIKQRTPITGLHNFLQGCHSDLKPYSQLLSDFRQPLADLKTKSNRELNAHIRSGQVELTHHINDFFDHLANQRDNQAAVGRQLDAFQKSLNGKFQMLASKRLEHIFEDFISGFQSAVASTYRSSELVRLPDFKLEQIEEKIPVVRSGTKKRNSIVGTLVGGAIGFALGGPAGAALGASLGGSAGGFTGSNAEVDYRSETFIIGDNLQEIRQQAIRNSETMFDQQVRQAAASLWSSMEQDVEQMLDKLTQEISDFDNKLGMLLQSTQRA